MSDASCEEEAKVHRPPHNSLDPDYVHSQLAGMLESVQDTTRESIQDFQIDSDRVLNESRKKVAKDIRRDHDQLDVDASIVQNLKDVLSHIFNTLTIVAIVLSIVITVYGSVTSIFVLDEEFNMTHSARVAVSIPPIFMNAIITVLVMLQKQIKIADRMEELTNIKKDADYVLSRLEPLYRDAAVADSLEELGTIDTAYKGETSSSMQQVTRAVAKVLKKEDQAVHTKTYLFYKLEKMDTKRVFERIRTLIMEGEQNGVPSEEITRAVHEFAGVMVEDGDEEDYTPITPRPSRRFGLWVKCCKKCKSKCLD